MVTLTQATYVVAADRGHRAVKAASKLARKAHDISPDRVVEVVAERRDSSTWAVTVVVDVGV